MSIYQVTMISDDIVNLAKVARGEGHLNIDKLVQEFSSGENCFDKPGERLFGVLNDHEVTAIGGVNIDPYHPSTKVARVRRLYVLPHWRRHGIGSTLMQEIESHAAKSFQSIQLFTDSSTASRFYLSRGYKRVGDRYKVSHAKPLQK